MACKDDKWVMFRNYMHNELGITKEDIRNWIDEAVQEQVKAIIDDRFKAWNLRTMTEEQIKTILKEDYELERLLREKILNSIEFKNGN